MSATRQLDVWTLFRPLSAPRHSTAGHVRLHDVGGQSSDVDHDVSNEGAKVYLNLHMTPLLLLRMGLYLYRRKALQKVHKNRDPQEGHRMAWMLG